MRATTAHRLNRNWLLSCPVLFVRHYRHYQIKSNQIYLQAQNMKEKTDDNQKFTK